MTQNAMKKAAAEAAIKYVERDTIIGVGTGSTVNFFIKALADIKQSTEGVVASSKASEALLKQHNIPVFDLNAAGSIALYVDGADEVNPYLYMTKGGGGALTREKIIAACAKTFICIADESKQVEVLGSQFALPVEVIPMARSYVAKELIKLGGQPQYREGFVTDNGNIILDVYNFEIMEPIKTEQAINNITGVVTNGIFAQRGADLLLLGSQDGVQTIKPKS